MKAVLIRRAEVDGRIVDVRLRGDRIEAVAARLRPEAGEDVLDAAGGALLPGLHDHHIHLLALAAANRSVRLGPPDVTDTGGFRGALEGADAGLPPGAWLRGIAYHESVAGVIDRHHLDAVVPHRPVRIQHRSGALWILNSVALDRAGIAGRPEPGVERDGAGRPTGRLFGLDAGLRDRFPADPPDLGAVGRQLLGYGVTGVTDATPTERVDDVALLAAAAVDGRLPLGLMITGGLGLSAEASPALPRGPVKLVVADHRLPDLGDLTAAIEVAHQRGRPVAIHCVTRVALILSLAAWEEAGPAPGDRVEHGAVVPPAEAARLATLGLTVVTQPSFVAERGDDYLADVEPDDRPHLWPCGSLLRAGIPVGGSTDAPFGHPDPWRAVAAATTRRTPSGTILGPDERVSPERALALFLTPPEAPGGVVRTVAPGAAADLCLLTARLSDALRAPSADLVAATIRAGVVHPVRL